MATAQHDIPVATVDAARRGDEILPEHEAQWPATENVRKLIAEVYDGTAGASHDIGLALAGRAYGPYPSWRIEQIAKTMGIHEFHQRAVIERSRAADTSERTRLQRTAGMPKPQLKGAKPVKAPAPSINQLICEQCNRAFEPWRMRQGVAFPTKLCRDCFSEKMIKAMSKSPTTPESAPSEANLNLSPNHLQQEQALGTAIAKTSIDWRPVWIEASEPQPVEEVDLEPVDYDLPETFSDLPESELVFALLDRLPVTGRWTSKQRQRWLKVFKATLDLLIDETDDDEAEVAQ